MTFGLALCWVLHGVTRVQFGFLAKPGFWLGSLVLGCGSFPSLCLQCFLMKRVTAAQFGVLISSTSQNPSQGNSVKLDGYLEILQTVQRMATESLSVGITLKLLESATMPASLLLECMLFFWPLALLLAIILPNSLIQPAEIHCQLFNSILFHYH